MTPPVLTVQFTVPGPPHGKERPRAGRHGFYTPDKTKLAEQRVRDAYRARRLPHLGDGPLHAEVHCVVARPKSHLLRDGSLSAAGRRVPLPTGKPDLDNAIKGVLDALNGVAYSDDSRVVTLKATRRWCVAGQDPHVRVLLSVLSVDSSPETAAHVA